MDDLPPELWRLVIAHMDWPTKCHARLASRKTREWCQAHYERRMADWVCGPEFERWSHLLRDKLDTACQCGNVVAARAIIAKMQSRVAAYGDAVVHSREWYDARSVVDEINSLLSRSVRDSGHARIVEALLQAGADPGQRDGISSLLHVAGARGRADLMALLLEAGADPNALDLYGNYPPTPTGVSVVGRKQSPWNSMGVQTPASSS